MEFPRQEYWSGLPFSTPGDLPDPGIEPVSLVSPALQVDSLPDEPPGKPRKYTEEAKLAFWLLNEERISDPKERERERASLLLHMLFLLILRNLSNKKIFYLLGCNRS